MSGDCVLLVSTNVKMYMMAQSDCATESKNGSAVLLAHNLLLLLTDFGKFLHIQSLQLICNEAIITDLTGTALTCRTVG